MNDIYITTGGKKDGVGSQLLSKILAMIYCQEHKFKYIHSPFKIFDYKDQDKTAEHYYKKGKGMEWVNKWEHFLNIGNGCLKETYINFDIIIDITKISKTGQIGKHDNYLWHDFNPLKNINDNIQKHSNKKILFIIKEFPKINFYKKENIDLILKKINYNYTLTPSPPMLFNKETFNIVIHKRHTRGNKLKKDSNLADKNSRITLNTFYIDIIKKLYEMYLDKNIQFWIFSDGEKNDFLEFKFISNNESLLEYKNINISIKMMLKTNSIETFHHFAKSDILIMDKSSFSYCGALFNKNKIIYTDYWDKPHYKWINSISI